MAHQFSEIFKAQFEGCKTLCLILDAVLFEPVSWIQQNAAKAAETTSFLTLQQVVDLIVVSGNLTCNFRAYYRL